MRRVPQALCTVIAAGRWSQSYAVAVEWNASLPYTTVPVVIWNCHVNKDEWTSEKSRLTDELCTIVVAAMSAMIRSKQLSRSSRASYSTSCDHP